MFQQVALILAGALPVVLALGTSKVCTSPVTSCGTTSSTDTCCFNTPGGQMALTQFWDTDPSTGARNSTVPASVVNFYFQDQQTRGLCMVFGPIIVTVHTTAVVTQPELTLASRQFLPRLGNLIW